MKFFKSAFRAVCLGIESFGMVCFRLLFKILHREMTPELEKSLRQFIRFCMIGLSNTLISWAVAYAVMFAFDGVLRDDVASVTGNVLGFIISIFNAYYWNQRFVFDKGERSHVAAFFRMAGAYTIGLVLSLVIPILCVNVFHITKWITPVLVLVIATPVNFLMNKLWAFGKKDQNA